MLVSKFIFLIMTVFFLIIITLLVFDGNIKEGNFKFLFEYYVHGNWRFIF